MANAWQQEFTLTVKIDPEDRALLKLIADKLGAKVQDAAVGSARRLVEGNGRDVPYCAGRFDDHCGQCGLCKVSNYG